MDSIEEKRVYGDREGATQIYVASSFGVVRVRVAGDTVGEFGLCERRDAVDVAATADGIAVATDDDVELLEPAANASDAELVGTGFGSAVAVGADGSRLLAAGPDGRVAYREDDEWQTLSDGFEPTVRAIDGDLLATDRGVYRVHDGGLDHAGLTDVRDVSAAGVPLAATADGLYKLGNGWMEVLEGSFEVVAADPRSEPGSLVRAHAVSETSVYEYGEEVGEWRELDVPGEIVDVGYADAVYAVTADGRFLAATDGEWRSQTLGIDGVTGLAVVPA
ncbi:hypothetical protein [Natronococcus sp. A-GB7]|uniref:HVO_0234 family beta-propeller protein n=1 Tax=Natronococcus sp. A-GB7 TaxID=3037649 RepID=UPI00241C3E58|nr:hypothetical protein [Natronococcus sp. A-GB7]MDG5819573.1 hypothetical protein [Natronococcus sp. A-GB7]